jgi:hypothetical protein
MREFRDDAGTIWQVWETVPGGARAWSLSDDDPLRRGWLTFQAGAARRRLAPYPADWESLPDERLDALRRQAAPVPSRGASETPTSARRTAAERDALARAAERARERDDAARAREERSREAAAAEDADDDAAPAGPIRTFIDARGERWLVAPYRARLPDHAEPREVLRFVASGKVLDLESFPDDWERLAVPQLEELLEVARAPRGDAASERAPDAGGPAPERRRGASPD